MDEMQMLRDHHDAQPSPSPHNVVTARARLSAHTRPRHRLPRLGRLSLGAGAAGLALTVGLVAVQVVDDDGKEGVLNAEPASATEVLDRAATAARHQPDPHPRAGQFVFAESLDDSYDAGINPDSHTKPGWTKNRRRVWLPVDGKQNGLLKEQTTTSHGKPVKQAWSAAPLRQPGGGPLNDPNNYTALNKLPRDPDQLLAELHRMYPAAHSDDPARDRTADEKVFNGIQGMVAESYLPPSLRAALFQAAEKIPGIILVRDSVDAAGRHGIAVALTFKEGIREEIIFDRRTYAPLGSRKVLSDPRAYDKLFVDLKGVRQGQTLSVTALLSTKIVDRPEQLS
jgi:hypothetical protein